jgi:hypothetical protein
MAQDKFHGRSSEWNMKRCLPVCDSARRRSFLTCSFWVQSVSNYLWLGLEVDRWIPIFTIPRSMGWDYWMLTQTCSKENRYWRALLSVCRPRETVFSTSRTQAKRATVLMWCDWFFICSPRAPGIDWGLAGSDYDRMIIALVLEGDESSNVTRQGTSKD